MRKHCDNSIKIEIAGMFRTQKISILTIEEIISKNYPNWLEILIENTTYF